MKAVIMAGGEGKRLRPVSGDTPKPMARLLGRPMIDHVIYLLRQHGFTDIIAALGYGAEAIAEHLGDGSAFGVSIRCSVERKPLGTAGGVKRAWNELAPGETILVISGDAACDLDLSLLLREHLEKSPAATMALHRRADPLGCGLVLTDSRGRVTGFIEKPGWERVVTDLVNAGIYILSPEALSLVPDGRPFDFARGLFPLLLELGMPVIGKLLPGYWCDAGTPEAYFRCNLDALHGYLRLSHPWGEDSPPAPEPVPERRRRGDVRRVFPCRDRAALMRALSESLAEFGADFTDGLTLKGPRGSVHISPDAGSSALVIEAEGKDARDICGKYCAMAEELEGKKP